MVARTRRFSDLTFRQPCWQADSERSLLVLLVAYQRRFTGARKHRFPCVKLVREAVGTIGAWPTSPDPVIRTGSRAKRARTCSSTPTTRSTGSHGDRTRSRVPRCSTGRSSSRSATPRATGATSWSASRSRTTATADALNAGFVAIKVDREERPDLDQLYMGAVQAMTGGGGWPMSVFLTPEGRPFYGGTYFPDTPRHGLPSFRQVLDGVRAAWTTQRTELEHPPPGWSRRSCRRRRSVPMARRPHPGRCPGPRSSTARRPGSSARSIASTAAGVGRRSSRRR